MKQKGSGWKGESRRHSLARKGIKTATGIRREYDHITKPHTFHNIDHMWKTNYTPTIYADRGAMDGEPFIWIQFMPDDDADWSDFVIIMDGESYEIVDRDGKVRYRTSDMHDAIKNLKQITFDQMEKDIFTHPYSKDSGWVEHDNLTTYGKEVYYDVKQKILGASGFPKPSRKDMEKFLWHKWNDWNPKATSNEVKNYKEYIRNRSDNEIQESYDRQKAINKPLTAHEQKMVDTGVRSIIKGGK